MPVRACVPTGLLHLMAPMAVIWLPGTEFLESPKIGPARRSVVDRKSVWLLSNDFLPPLTRLNGHHNPAAMITARRI
jgi:hypothetical protein